jgi:SAM-dependent methyltransferase
LLEPAGAASAWADIPDEEVAEFVRAARREGFEPALTAYERRAPAFVRRIRKTTLGNWHVLLARPARSRVLDVGCGFGALLAGLQAAYAQSYGVEVLAERLQIAALRDPLGVPRVVRGSGHALPFRVDVVDLAVLNGVLEWAAYYRAGDPGQLQLNMLRELRRVVHPDGTLAVAIENRFALETLVGLPDTHTSLLFVPALPKPLANLWSHVRTRREYRTLLYSRASYPVLFGSAGWSPVRLLDLAPSYNDYDFVIDPADRASYALLWGRGWMRSFVRPAGMVRRLLAALRPAVLGDLSYAYLVLAGRTPMALDQDFELWRILERAGFDPGASRFGADTLQVGTAAVVTHREGRIGGVVLLSRRPESGVFPSLLRSKPLADYLEGRVRQAADTEIANYHVTAYTVRS